MQKKDDKIELRSEKMRNIIGEIPPRLVRISTAIIALVIIMIAIAAFSIHYPDDSGKTIVQLIFG